MFAHDVKKRTGFMIDYPNDNQTLAEILLTFGALAVIAAGIGYIIVTLLSF